MQAVPPGQVSQHLQQLLGGPLQLGVGMANPLAHLLLLRCLAHTPLLTGLSPTAMSGLGLGPGAMPMGPQHPLMYQMLGGMLPGMLPPGSQPGVQPGSATPQMPGHVRVFV